MHYHVIAKNKNASYRKRIAHSDRFWVKLLVVSQCQW